MHPFALYLAATDIQRDYRASGRDRRPQYAASDALPVSEPAPVSRVGRLVSIFRRQVGRASSM